MSLLMDALKKAELAKQQGQAIDIAAAEPQLKTEIDLPATPEPRLAVPASLPELAPRLELLDAEFLAHHAQQNPAPRNGSGADRIPATANAVESTARPRPATPGERSAAQNVFTAKQPSGGKKSFALVVGLLTLVAAAAIGIYFWLQLSPPNRLATMSAPLPAATAPAPRPIAATAPPVVVTPPPAPPAEPEVPVATVAAPKPETKPLARVEPRQPASPTTAIRITASRQGAQASLTQAYEALNAGNLPAARAAYNQVLKTEGRNADALHGLAAIALREGQPALAEVHYLQALEADPKDALALAGLIGLQGQTDPVVAESRLKTLLAAQPELPLLHFALGNVYARQSRWSEAQQAYFKAVGGDADNPDYLFNLAVSLDHLRQGRLATQYYNEAMAAATARPAGFDRAQAATRLRDLQP